MGYNSKPNALIEMKTRIMSLLSFVYAHNVGTLKCDITPSVTLWYSIYFIFTMSGSITSGR